LQGAPSHIYKPEKRREHFLCCMYCAFYRELSQNQQMHKTINKYKMYLQPLHTFQQINCHPQGVLIKELQVLIASKQTNIQIPVKMGLIRCPETSVKNYHTMPRNNPEEHRSHQHRGRSLKSRVIPFPSLALPPFSSDLFHLLSSSQSQI
jgi:hypothetical protein